MAQFFTDFTEYADTAALDAEWIQTWDSNVGYNQSLQATEGVGSTPAMRIGPQPQTFLRFGTKWNVVPDVADVNMIARIRTTASQGFNDDTRFGFIARGSGTSSASATGYIGAYMRQNFRVSRYISGSFGNAATTTLIPTDDGIWYWVRYRASGSTHQARIWVDGDSEPGTWDIDVTNTSITAAGYVGFFCGGNAPGNIFMDRFGVGIDGDTAPVEPPTAKATVTVSSTLPDAQLTDYPAYIDLAHATPAFWNAVANGGGDIRCYLPDGTPLAREVVSCDTATDTGELHVKIPTLSIITDTVVELHADGTSSEPASTANYGSEAVWSDYALVAHLDSASNTDSSGNGGISWTNTPGTTAGPNGYLVADFDGVDDYGTIADRADLSILTSGSESLVQAWVRPDSDPGAVSGGEFLILYKDSEYIAHLDDVTSDSNDGTTGPRFSTFGDSNLDVISNSVAVSSWSLLHWRIDAGTQYEAYIDGATNGNKSSSDTSSDTSNALYVGANDTPDQYFDGGIGSLRIRSSIPTSADDWISTEYANQSAPNTFYTVSAVGGGGVDVSPYGIQVLQRSYQSVAASRLNGVLQ